MLGRILDYSTDTEQGIISGDDGQRYRFVVAEWKEANTPPRRGMRVDFVGEAETASAIYLSVQPAASSIDLAQSLHRLTDPGTGAAGETVEPARRFLAFLVEIGIGLGVFLLVRTMVLLPLGVSAFRFGLGAVFLWVVLGGIVTTAVLAAYYWLMYTRYGAGAGHLLIGARAVDADTGESMSQRQATIRAGAAALPWLFFGIWGAGLVGLWMLCQLANGLVLVTNDDRRNLYDRLAATKVVNVRDREISRGDS